MTQIDWLAKLRETAAEWDDGYVRPDPTTVARMLGVIEEYAEWGLGSHAEVDHALEHLRSHVCGVGDPEQKHVEGGE